MPVFYSATTNGFYHGQFHSEEKMPSDRVEITDEEHAALLKAQSDGLVIKPGPEGKPTTEKRDGKEDQARFVGPAANALLEKSDKVLLRCLEEGMPISAAWKQYRLALRNVVSGQSTELPPTPEMPDGI